MRKLAILGASGHGKVAADIALQSGWDEVYFFDDRREAPSHLENWPVLGNTQSLLHRISEFSGVFVAIGNNSVRYDKLCLLSDSGMPLVTLIHPRAIVSPYATLAEGVMVVGGAVVNAFCTIARGGIVNTGATVGHDCQLDQCVHIAPGANIAGEVTIGPLSWIGIGSAIRQGINVGSCVTIGAGAAVVCDVSDDQVMVGIPAKPHNKKLG